MCRSQSENRPQLRAHDFRVSQQQTRTSETERWVGFRQKGKIAKQLVTDHIQRANHDRAWLHLLRRRPINLVLLLFAGEMILDQEHEFGSIEPNTLRERGVFRPDPPPGCRWSPREVARESIERSGLFWSAQSNRRFDSGPPSLRDPLFGRPGDNRFDDLWDQEQHDGAAEVLAHGFHVACT